MVRKMTVKKDFVNIEKLYQDKVAKQLMKKFEYSNVLQVPKITKIVVNMGLGDAKEQ